MPEQSHNCQRISGNWLDCDHLEKDDLTTEQLLGIVKHKINHNYVTEEKGMTEQAVGEIKKESE